MTFTAQNLQRCDAPWPVRRPNYAPVLANRYQAAFQRALRCAIPMLPRRWSRRISQTRCYYRLEKHRRVNRRDPKIAIA